MSMTKHFDNRAAAEADLKAHGYFPSLHSNSKWRGKGFIAHIHPQTMKDPRSKAVAVFYMQRARPRREA